MQSKHPPHFSSAPSHCAYFSLSTLAELSMMLPFGCDSYTLSCFAFWRLHTLVLVFAQVGLGDPVIAHMFLCGLETQMAFLLGSHLACRVIPGIELVAL